MKKELFKYIILLILFSITVFPEVCSDGVALGINLLTNSLIPAIFCFIIFSNFVILSGYSTYLGRLFHPIIHFLFNTSYNGSYAVVMGFLCGFPIGSKIVSDLENTSKISHEEASYLYNFINHASPAFIQGYLVYSLLKIPYHRLTILFIIYAPEIILGLIYRPKKAFVSPITDKIELKYPFSKLIDDSVSSGLKSIIKISFFVIIFSVIVCFINKCFFIPSVIKLFLISACEMTSGLYFLMSYPLKKEIIILLSSYICIFGGISTIFQIKSIVSTNSFNIIQ